MPTYSVRVDSDKEDAPSTIVTLDKRKGKIIANVHGRDSEELSDVGENVHFMIQGKEIDHIDIIAHSNQREVARLEPLEPINRGGEWIVRIEDGEETNLPSLVEALQFTFVDLCNRFGPILVSRAASVSDE